MSTVPLYHPLVGQGGVLEECAPDSPRDAWAWLARRPGLAARAGVNHILAHSPSSRLHVLYLTNRQIASVERGSRVGVLCAWTAEFDGWQPGHDVVLEANEVRLQYSLRSVRYFMSADEMVQETQGLANSGMSLVYDQPRESGKDAGPEQEPAAEPRGIPIPSRGRRPGLTTVYVGVLLELAPRPGQHPGDQLKD